MRLGDFLIAYLRRAEVDRIFGIPGDLVLRLFSALEDQHFWRMITFSHEPAVGFAADGYARATGRLGVACVTYGAGGHNMVNAVAGAWAEHVPLLVLSGGPGEEETRHGTLIHHQARAIESQLRIYREVTAAAEVVDDPRTAAATIDGVVRAMWAERRPGYIEIHRDMVDRVIEVPREIREAGPPLIVSRIDPARVREAARDAAERLDAARKPVVLVGIEVNRFRAESQVLELCERLGAPVLTPMLAKGAVPMDHPLYMGVFLGPFSPPAIRRRVREADLILDLGCMVTDIGSFAERPAWARSIRAIDGRVDVSFHTYRDVPLKDFVRVLLEQKLRRHRERIAYHDNLPAVPAWLRAQPESPSRRAAAGRRAPGSGARAGPLRVAEMLLALNRFLVARRGYVVVAEAGDMLFAGIDLRVPGRAAYFAQGFYASMGFGVPGAMGIEIGDGRRPIVLCGDGAFQMTGSEIAHAPRHGLKPIVIVVNNGGWAIFRPVVKQKKMLEIPDWPHAEMARLWGGHGARVTTGPEFTGALEQAAASDRFFILEAMIAPDDLSPLSRRYIRASARRGGRA